jgi:hypothetical protein
MQADPFHRVPAAAGAGSSSIVGQQEVVDSKDWEMRYGVKATPFERFVWPVAAADPDWMSSGSYKAAAADPLKLN